MTFHIDVLGHYIRIVAIVFGILWITIGIYNSIPSFNYIYVKKILKKDVYYSWDEDLPKEDLPSIDVLLPAYREGRTLRECIGNIRNSEYPQELIRVVVLTEPGDEMTKGMLEDIRTTVDDSDLSFKYFEEIEVPEEYPGDGNKPRALNYGYEMTNSDIVGIVDAEDVVSDTLFKSVAHAIVRGGYDYVQGILDMSNEDDGWLCTMFRGEYGFWYRFQIPSFYSVGYPVPLGGTTNFCTREVLDTISEKRREEFGIRWDSEEVDEDWIKEESIEGKIPWDPLNVTEDFELGFILWLLEYDLTLIDEVTREESPTEVPVWIKQRTRWEKGKIFTLFQYIKVPPRNTYEKFHVYFQSFLPHLGMINMVGVLQMVIIAYLIGFEYTPYVEAITLVGLFLIFFEIGKHMYGYWMATDKISWLRVKRTLYSLTLPLYWVIFWIGGIRAMKQFYTNDLQWEKTEHKGRHLDE